jgi:hypothetical protein
LAEAGAGAEVPNEFPPNGFGVAEANALGAVELANGFDAVIPEEPNGLDEVADSDGTAPGAPKLELGAKVGAADGVANENGEGAAVAVEPKIDEVEAGAGVANGLDAAEVEVAKGVAAGLLKSVVPMLKPAPI